MKKFLLMMLMGVLVFAFIGCAKTQTTDQNTVKKDTTDQAAKDIQANALKNTKTVSNSGSMDITTSPRNAAKVAENKAALEKLAEEVIKYAAGKGVDNAKEEVNKSRAGAFAGSFPDISLFYLVIFQYTGNSWQIGAHAVSRDFIGVEVDTSKWADLSGWSYLKSTLEASSTPDTAVWLKNVYWKDPSWAQAAICRFDAYSRFFVIDNKKYWFYANIWLDE